MHIYGQPQRDPIRAPQLAAERVELPKSLALAEAGELPAGWDDESGRLASSIRVTGTRGRTQRA